MEKSSVKIIEASAATKAGDVQKIGMGLQRLRLKSDLTQGQIAERMKVKLAKISKIESGRDILPSTVQRYIKALGADARLLVSDSTSLEFTNSLIDYEPSDQFTLFSKDSQSDIILSINPVYSEKILEGRKTVELRRRFPIPASHKIIAYIYETAPTKAIVGTAEIFYILKLPVENIWTEFEASAFIERDKFDEYFEGLSEGYALRLHNARAFTKPIPLAELREKFGFEPPQSFLYAKHDLRKALRNEHAI